MKWLWYNRIDKPLLDFKVFDRASRGPLGAVQLLLRVPILSISSIGCIVIILALASDAFVQQLLSYPLLSIAQESATAGIPYT
jgi:hypothetical protein